jgi:hypothetical protein
MQSGKTLKNRQFGEKRRDFHHWKEPYCTWTIGKMPWSYFTNKQDLTHHMVQGVKVKIHSLEKKPLLGHPAHLGTARKLFPEDWFCLCSSIQRLLQLGSRWAWILLPLTTELGIGLVVLVLQVYRVKVMGHGGCYHISKERLRGQMTYGRVESLHPPMRGQCVTRFLIFTGAYN